MTELGKAGFLYRGNYSASDTYNRMDVVTYLPNVYICLKNVVRNITPNDDGINWKLFIKGASIQTTAEMLAALDNAQATADSAIAKIGNVPTGKTLQSQIDGLEPRVSSSEQALTVNLLNPTSPSGTLSGITVVRNADNSYTISGTNTSEGTSTIALALITSIGFENGKTYRVLGCPSNTPAGVYIRVGAQIKENGEGANFTYPVQSGQQIFISIVAGTVIETPITIKPMITTNLSATYDDFVPFSGSSGKLDTDYKTLSDKIGNVGNTDLQSQLNAEGTKLNSLMTCSTNEHVVGTWTDGRAIYERTYSVTTPSTAGTWSTVINTNGLSIDIILGIDGTIIDTNGQIPLNYTDPLSADNLSAVRISNGNVLQLVKGYTGKSESITIQYVKNTVI